MNYQNILKKKYIFNMKKKRKIIWNEVTRATLTAIWGSWQNVINPILRDN